MPAQAVISTIRDIHNPWRDALLPAMFDGCPFHVEASSRESGRRTVVHEYPKRDTCYSEDMGQRAVEVSVRGYVIAFMRDADLAAFANVRNIFTLYLRDYRYARDQLQQRLDRGGEGVLVLPNSGRAAFGSPLTLTAVCTRYRMTEEDRFGGFCVFDMGFVDYGAYATPGNSPTGALLAKIEDAFLQATYAVAAGPPGPPP
jgi:hypothetical protein